MKLFIPILQSEAMSFGLLFFHSS